MNIYHELKESKQPIKGLVRMTKFDENFGEDVLILEQGKTKCYIPRSLLDIRPIKTSLMRYLGKDVSFIIVDVNEEDGYVVGSVAEVKRLAHDELIQQFQENPEIQVEATVSHIVRYGAYLLINGVSVLMRNQDFAQDYTSIGEVLKAGDKLMVRPVKITTSKIIVEAIEKYCAETSITIDDFSEGMVVLGRINTIKEASHCFTSIAPNLDGISPIPEFEIAEGMRVFYRINQKREDGRVRGKILSVVDESEEI